MIFQLGGAIARVGEHATAYSHRDAAHNVNINAVWPPGDAAAPAHVCWTREFFTALERKCDPSNFFRLNQKVKPA